MSAPDPYEVRRYGTDTSGRPILLSVGLKAAFDEVCRRARVTPTIVQGAYMSRTGGGAGASAGTHDEGACIDTRTWDLTSLQRRRLIREGRKAGFQAVWFRNMRHGGFDEHCHWNYGGDRDATSDARWQWTEYKAGRDGLASRGRDYHWRPKPIPTFPYAHWLVKDWFDMATKRELQDAVLDVVQTAEFGHAVRRAVLHDSDIFPNDKARNESVNSLFARLSNWLDNRK